ncbi:hypothetical protein EPI10_021134 [Gossypium australe]|uniref:Uncharacterized protein n=1 Tax=Gossypium australe TaxID=47621 RepID=A0A5B6WHN7_9ROSI|nr:hypothetical protein EPI10_021134 [Gossypium australe]
MGKHYHGLCIVITPVSEEEKRHLGNCRPIDKVCTLYSGCMECRSPIFQIEILDLHPDSRTN